ncbi:hypothetical protein PoB_005684400 [Plakobranchus ocellatus]|uniref:Uncharacterized protein n=1 Tax=Plakobranchus ocellatus TaxID=259542 RepID=A0AAV4CGN0_9GAST|nr:hypothetical protein PoB_005684400 [Plakobranchus ocellatus]
MTHCSKISLIIYLSLNMGNCIENNNNKNNSNGINNTNSIITSTKNNNNNSSIANCHSGNNNKGYYRTDQNNIQDSSIKTTEFGQDRNDKTISKNSIEQK